jgi:hypothetical protein
LGEERLGEEGRWRAEERRRGEGPVVVVLVVVVLPEVVVLPIAGQLEVVVHAALSSNLK